jgi:hypothetical protein
MRNKVKKAEYDKAYRKRNIKKVREWRNNWNKNNPEKKKEMDKRYRENHRWIVHYSHAKQRCTNPKASSYKSYGGKGIKFNLTLKEVKKLWFRDKAYEMEQPSIDRIDTYGDYTFSNCRFLEFDKNNKRSKRKKENIK